MKIYKNLIPLVLTSGIVLASCSNTSIVKSAAPVEETVYEVESEINASNSCIQDIKTIPERKPSDATITEYIKTIHEVNLRSEENLNCEILDVVPNNVTFVKFEECDEFYKVEFNGVTGYIHKDMASKKKKAIMPYEPRKVAYLKESAELLTEDTEPITLNKLECIEVFEEYGDKYLTIIDGNVGFVNKDKTEDLEGVFVVVDISEQELKLYEDNLVILTSPIVSGKKSSPSTEGLFSVYDISHNRYLVGPGYKSYVDIMMKYHNGEGLHDAEYHVNEDGKKHGWRTREEFGGETYIKRGSHGCINMPQEEVMEVSNHVSVGTKVLVKK